MAFEQSYSTREAEVSADRYYLLTSDAIRAGYKLMRPSTEHVTIVRVLPAYSDMHDCVLPAREPGHGLAIAPFTDWIWPMRVWQGGLNKSFLAFIAELPGDRPGTLAPASIKSPPAILYDKLNTLVESDEAGPDGTPFSRYHTLLKGARGRGAAVSRVKVNAFVQVFRIAHRGKEYTKASVDENSRFVLSLPISAKTGLEKMCNAEVPDWHKKGINPESPERFLAGNWLGHEAVTVGPRQLLPGRMLSIAYHDNAASATDVDASAVNFDAPSGGGGGGSGGDREENQMYYEVKLMKDLPIPVDLPKKYWRPWEQTLRLFTAEEQVQLLISSGLPRNIIMASFNDTQWLPESYRTMKVTSVTARGAGLTDPRTAGNAGAQSAIGTPLPGGAEAASNSVMASAEDAGDFSFSFEEIPTESLPLGDLNTPEGPVGVQTTKPAVTMGQPAPALDPAAARSRSEAEIEKMKTARAHLSKKPA